MSVRLLTSRILKNAKYILHSYWRRDIHTNILEQNQTRTRQRFSAARWSNNALTSNNGGSIQIAKTVLQASANNNVGATAQNVARSSGLFRFGQQARKIFIDNLLNRVTTTYSHELREQAKKKLFYGDSAPFFALVGVSLASGTGVLTKEDELEGVCWEIREAASRLQSTWSYDEISETLDTHFNVDKLDIGPPIAKGCAAVVYAASLKSERQEPQTPEACEDKIEGVPKAIHKQYSAYGPELLSPLQHMSRFVHNFGGSLDNLNIYNQSVTAANFATQLAEQKQEEKRKEENTIKDGGSLISLMAENSNMASIQRYPLALKMMFNYDIQSNAMCILRAMYKEIVPARQRLCATTNGDGEESWERLLQESTVDLPPHPNIVCMYGYFVDEVHALPEGSHLYPVAQPPRINPNGYGRNMSLYLLMKRYNYSLRELLDTHSLSMRTKMLLLAQLLEAVAHLTRHGIAHRDLKSDNLLIELTDEEAAAPLLVVTDFGCCLADSQHGLKLPYTSMDIDKGGNAALMAPEIINKKPGTFSVLNYAKADLWACGAIAYEIFGQRNPFYAVSPASYVGNDKERPTSLRNCDYREDELPSISDNECPPLVKELIYSMLHPNPNKRISADIAANVMQLYLWAPSKWLRAFDSTMPNSPEILQWLLSLSSKVMCAGRADLSAHTYGHKGRRTYVEYLLLCSFLSRVRLRRIRGALNWIHENVNV